MREPDLVAAMQAALATEHAAVWAYGVASAFLPQDLADERRQAMAAHRSRRDALERRLLAAGAVPVPTQAAYQVRAPIDDADDALRLLVTAEADAAAAWRAVVEFSAPNTGLRTTASGALTDAAVRASRWRAEAGLEPVTVPFPGAP